MLTNVIEEVSNLSQDGQEEQYQLHRSQLVEDTEESSSTETPFFSTSEIFSDDSNASFVSMESNFWGEYEEVLEVEQSIVNETEEEEEEKEEEKEEAEDQNKKENDDETYLSNNETNDVKKKSMVVIFNVLREPSSENQDFLPFNVVRECVPWRMNLMACSKLQPSLFFVACDDTVVVFNLDHSKLQCLKEIQRIPLQPPESFSAAHPKPTINYILVSFLGVHEILLAADDVGRVHLWLTSTLKNSVVLNAAPCNSSVWGLDLHPDTWILAASSNSHIIKLMDLRIVSPFSNILHFPSFPSWRTSSSTRSILDNPNGIKYLQGHEHNIPCVSFNKTGTLLASSSIDCTIRIWEVGTGNCIRRIRCAQWMWQVRFLPFPMCSFFSPNELDEHVICTGDAGVEVFNVYQRSALLFSQPSRPRTVTWSSWLGTVDRMNMMFVFDSCVIVLHQSGKLLFLPLMPFSNPSYPDPRAQFEFLDLLLPFPSSPILGCFVQLKNNPLGVRVFITFFDADALIVDIQPILVDRMVDPTRPSVTCLRHPSLQSPFWSELLKRISGELCT